jgi:hypothetical protein
VITVRSLVDWISSTGQCSKTQSKYKKPHVTTLMSDYCDHYRELVGTEQDSAEQSCSRSGLSPSPSSEPSGYRNEQVMQEFSGNAHALWYWSSAVNITSEGPHGEKEGEERRRGGEGGRRRCKRGEGGIRKHDRGIGEGTSCGGDVLVQC